MAVKNYPVNITRKQIILSIPVFLKFSYSISSIVDTGLMGNLGDSKYLAATSMAAIMTMIIWSFGFLRMGTVGMVAQLFAEVIVEIVKTLIKIF